MFHYPLAKEINDLNEVMPDFLYTVTFRRNWRAVLMVWFSDFKIQYYVPKGVNRNLAEALLEYEYYRHLAECGFERPLFEYYDDEYREDLELDAESALRRFWKCLGAGDEEQSVSEVADNPQDQVADKS